MIVITKNTILGTVFIVNVMLMNKIYPIINSYFKMDSKKYNIELKINIYEKIKDQEIEKILDRYQYIKYIIILILFIFSFYIYEIDLFYRILVVCSISIILFIILIISYFGQFLNHQIIEKNTSNLQENNYSIHIFVKNIK